MSTLKAKAKLRDARAAAREALQMLEDVERKPGLGRQSFHHEKYAIAQASDKINAALDSL